MAMTSKEERRERRFIDEERKRIDRNFYERESFMQYLRENHPELAYVIENEDTREHHEKEGPPSAI